MANLKFKDFTWRNVPEVYREVTTREPQYTTQDGSSAYTGMSYLHRTITGSGAFLGQPVLLSDQTGNRTGQPDRSRLLQLRLY